MCTKRNVRFLITSKEYRGRKKVNEAEHVQEVYDCITCLVNDLISAYCVYNDEPYRLTYCVFTGKYVSLQFELHWSEANVSFKRVINFKTLVDE